MTSIFDKLTSDGLEETEDRLRGGRPVLETNIYPAVIQMAYAGKSESGATSITILFNLPGAPFPNYEERFWVTNKKGENFFRNKQDTTKKIPLPGFTVVDDICIVTTDAPLSDQETETKVLKLWNPKNQQEEPTQVPVLVDLIGKELSVAIFKQLENKRALSGSEWVDTAETQEVNFIDKVFHEPTGLTVVEARRGLTEGEFKEVWQERNQGEVKDRRSIKGAPDAAGMKAALDGASAKKGSAPSPKKSLFK